MIYKIVMMSGQEIAIESEEALQRFLTEANAGKRLILTRYGVVNVSSIDSIVPNHERMERYHDLLRDGYLEIEQGQTRQDAALERTLGPSPFAQFLAEGRAALANKMTMLSPGVRAEVAEDVAKQERKDKT